MGFRWNVQSNQGQIDDVKDSNAIYDLLGSSRNLLPWIRCLGGGETGKLSARVGEGSIDEDAAEAVEAIEKAGIAVWLLAVLFC